MSDVTLLLEAMTAGDPQAAGQLLPLVYDELRKQVRDALQKRPAANLADLLTVLDNLASVYQDAGRLKDALKLFEKVRASRTAKFGPDHPDTLTTLYNLAGAYLEAGKHAEAIDLLRQVLAAREEKLPPDHPATLITLNSLAAAYWMTGQLDRSIPLFEDALKRMQAKLGRTHPETLNTMANLGINYRDAKRLDEAIPVLEQAYRQGQAHARLGWVGNELLDAYARAGKGKEAAALAPVIVARARQQLPPASGALAGVLATVGTRLLELKQYRDAEPLVRECLALRDRLSQQPMSGIAPWQVASARCLVGAALLGQKKHGDAAPLLLAGVEGLRKHEAAIPPRSRSIITVAMGRLVELYEATSNPDAAAKWRKELAARSRR